MFGRDGCKVFMCERKVSNLIYYLDILFLDILIFINNQGRQHKMIKMRPGATGCLQTICVIKYFICKRKVSNFIISYLI